jgi:hypothetical protein
MDAMELQVLAKRIVGEMNKLHSADLAQKWEGATITITPNNPDLKEQEIPVDTLMHKIVMVRDNLRVLEQQINSNKTLTEGEKLKYQNYISRCYGSMTSFNFLFANQEDKFSSK